MKKVKVSVLRDELLKKTKNDLKELESVHSIKLTSAAKRGLIDSVSKVFRGGSPDLKRIGKVRTMGHRAVYRQSSQRRSLKRIYVQDEINVTEKTTESVKKVIASASKIAKKEGLHKRITVSHVDAAIVENWCSIFPLCNIETSRKLGLNIIEENNDE